MLLFLRNLRNEVGESFFFCYIACAYSMSFLSIWGEEVKSRGEAKGRGETNGMIAPPVLGSCDSASFWRASIRRPVM